jgi:hypothetical protein
MAALIAKIPWGLKLSRTWSIAATSMATPLKFIGFNK